MIAVQKPLLLHPDLAEVRVALEAQDEELAATLLRAVMARGGALGADNVECNYLLGVIEERAGAVGRAIAAFENATRSPWPLQGDAVIHLVRLELQRNDCSRAEERLKSFMADASEAPVVGDLAARIELCAHRWESAAARLRQLIAKGGDPNHRREQQLLLAQTLLEQARLNHLPADAARQQAADMLRDTLAEDGANAAVLERAKGILVELVALPHGSASDPELLVERTALLEATVDARRFSEGKSLSDALLAQLSATAEQNQLYCRVAFAAGRIAAGTSNTKAAIDGFDWVSRHCDDDDLAARALFLAAGQHSATKKRTDAIARYAELEQRFPGHRLADDARLKQANLYRTIGADSRFVGLLDTLPDAYPNGDMLLEGSFQLAQKSMLERNWAAALSVLERGERLLSSTNRGKDSEIDRLKYFLARARIAQGQLDQGLEGFKELVIRRPLSYYMLLAYSTLVRLRPDVAAQALQNGASKGTEPPRFGEAKTVQEQRALERVLMLLGVGDVEAAEDTLRDAGTRKMGENAVFAVATMFANAGATKTALTLAKRQGLDCRMTWPTGGWIELWRQAYPRPYLDLVRQQSGLSGAPQSLIYAIMREESEFDPKAISVAGAYGLMQLIVPTARTAARGLGIVASAKSLQRPDVNITLGSRVLAQLMERFQGQVALVAAGYNAGPGRPARWLRTYPEVELDLWVELIEYPETRNYVKRVLESQAVYRWLYGTNGAPEATIEVVPERFASGRAEP